MSLDQLLEFLRRLYLERPWCLLAWPAAAMVLGTLVPSVSKNLTSRLAVVPRTPGGLVGIVAAPFVHAGAAHLAANLPPFVGLGALVLLRNPSGFIGVAGAIAAATGALVWLLGRRAAHIGMSGVVFGFLGHLLAAAWLTRTTPDLLVAGAVLLYYGGMLAGVKPVRSGTSWESHLLGLLAGIGTAWLGLGTP